MQKPFAYSPANKISQHFILTGRQISIIALAGAILLYLYYPGVRDQFVQKELSLMTPEQRTAMQQMQQANAAAAAAFSQPPGMPNPSPTPNTPPTAPKA